MIWVFADILIFLASTRIHVVIAKIKVSESVIILLIFRLFCFSKIRQIIQTGHLCLLLFIVAGIRIVKRSSLSRFCYIILAPLLFLVSSILPAIIIVTPWTLNMRDGWSMIIILLTSGSLSKIRFHLIWAIWIFIGTHWSFLSAIILMGIWSIVSYSDLFHHCQDQGFWSIIVTTHYSAFSSHFLSWLWEIFI